MLTVTLLSKVYNSFQLKYVGKYLKMMLKDLNVEAKVLGTVSQGWVQICLDGEDEKVALHYLSEEFGLCPSSLENIERFSTAKGWITAFNKDRNELCIDIGVFSPEIVHAIVPLHDLQAKLVDGRKIALAQIARLYGLCENISLLVKVNRIDKKTNRVEAFLSEGQRTWYKTWTNSMLDRLIILGASRPEVESALKATASNRDVIQIEPLGLFEQVAVCKFGTDAKGLIPKIGKNLKNTVFSVFNPKKLWEFLNFSPMFV